MYQTMFDETIRLRNCKSKVERREIRRFILEAYQLYAEKNPNNVNQNISPTDTTPQEIKTLEVVNKEESRKGENGCQKYHT